MIFLFFFFVTAGMQNGNAAGITLQSSQKVISLENSNTLRGHGSGQIGEIQISANSGTIEINQKKMETFLQERIGWEGMGTVLYQGLALNQNQFYVYWIYCDLKDKLIDVYYESSDSSEVKVEAASGTCTSLANTTKSTVSIPSMNLEQPTPISGFNIKGNSIKLSSGNIGTLKDWSAKRVEDQDLKFLPFSTINCAACSAGGPAAGKGWYELHSLVWNDTQSKVCFAIIYLFADHKRDPQISHSLCLSDLSNSLDSINLTAEWESVPQATSAVKAQQ